MRNPIHPHLIRVLQVAKRMTGVLGVSYPTHIQVQATQRNACPYRPGPAHAVALPSAMAAPPLQHKLNMPAASQLAAPLRAHSSRPSADSNQDNSDMFVLIQVVSATIPTALDITALYFSEHPFLRFSRSTLQH